MRRGSFLRGLRSFWFSPCCPDGWRTPPAMKSRRSFLRSTVLAPAVIGLVKASGDLAPQLDPVGKVHIPIGIPDTLDTLKTFVEAEGNFSPGVGSYGIYFWFWDADAGRLVAPTMESVTVEHGLAGSGLLIPWSRWEVDGVFVKTEVCEVEVDSPKGKVFVTAARVVIENRSGRRRRFSLYAALRPLGPAGWDVKRLESAANGSAILLVDGHTAMLADRRPAGAGVLDTDTIGNFAIAGRLPDQKSAQSASGDCSGAMKFDFQTEARRRETIGFVCPVLIGRRAARHKWVDLKQNAMVDVAELNPSEGGIPQPDPGREFFSGLRVDALFEQAKAYWTKFLSRLDVQVPDPRWGESMRVILGHAALCMNEGAADVAVVNYNVFNRDGMYIANMMQKSAVAPMSDAVIDYFLRHPFNGRAYPEADNPGQILWAIHEHYLLTRDKVWLNGVYPAVRKIARMIEYYRTTPGPHWVGMNRLDFGEAVPASEREELRPGRCDGYHPEYTEAFDIAGLRGAAALAQAMGHGDEEQEWTRLADTLMVEYDKKFGSNLGRQYGSYCVLWPCRLYPTQTGKAWEQFRGIGARVPNDWRYFPLATAHQGLLAGNRAAGHGTLEIHLDHEQMRGWYAFDEGGGSGSGGWHKTRTTWTHSKEKPGENLAVAMPHGWAIAEFWLLMRDCLVFEDEERLVLLSGIAPEWFRHPKGLSAGGLATYFGSLDIAYRPDSSGARLTLGGDAVPPKGYLLRLPAQLNAEVWIGKNRIAVQDGGDCLLPQGAGEVRLRF
jgi:hypothetical protein